MVTTPLTAAQTLHYNEVLRARDEVAYAYWKSQTAKLGQDSTDAARELANCRSHFTLALNQLLESIKHHEH